MRIGVLGPLEVRDDAGAPVPVGGARLRSLLIRLAVGDGRPISVERLADDLWADGAPADAANAVQALVSRLRGALGRDAIEHGPAGYRLAVPPAARSMPARSSSWSGGAGRRWPTATTSPARRCCTRRWACGAGRRWPTWPTRRSRPRRSPG